MSCQQVGQKRAKQFERESERRELKIFLCYGLALKLENVEIHAPNFPYGYYFV